MFVIDKLFNSKLRARPIRCSIRIARSDHAEAMAAADALRLPREAGTKYYGVHTSGKESNDVIEAHRDDGSLTRAETCMHYTGLNRSAYKRDGCLPIMAPLLQKDADRDAMFEYLTRKTLDVVLTEHCRNHTRGKDIGFMVGCRVRDQWTLVQSPGLSRRCCRSSAIILSIPRSSYISATGTDVRPRNERPDLSQLRCRYRRVRPDSNPNSQCRKRYLHCRLLNLRGPQADWRSRDSARQR